MPSSGWKGAPILRETSTSSGASSARATSAPTGTPPRGSASTIGFSSASASRAWPSLCPASTRLRNRMAILLADRTLEQSLCQRSSCVDGERWPQRLRAPSSGGRRVGPGCGVGDGAEVALGDDADALLGLAADRKRAEFLLA